MRRHGRLDRLERQFPDPQQIRPIRFATEDEAGTGWRDLEGNLLTAGPDELPEGNAQWVLITVHRDERGDPIGPR